MCKMIVINTHLITPIYNYVFPRPYLAQDVCVEEINEVDKYIKETFIPGIDEILHQIFNLYNITILMESCVRNTKKHGWRDIIFVNDTFMEDYIYRFISLRKKIEEYIEIYSKFDTKFYEPMIRNIFNIEYDWRRNRINMCSRTPGHESYCKIGVRKKYQYLKNIL